MGARSLIDDIADALTERGVYGDRALGLLSDIEALPKYQRALAIMEAVDNDVDHDEIEGRRDPIWANGYRGGWHDAFARLRSIAVPETDKENP